MKRSPLRFAIVCLSHVCPLTSVTSAQSTANPSPRTDDQPVQLSAFEVSTDRDTAYRANNAVSATRTNTAIRDTPQSVTVLTEQFLDDIEAISVNEALAYVAGVSSAEAGVAGDDPVNLRGQLLTSQLIDGLPDRNTNVRPDQSIIERVEVIKGSSSSLYGSSSPAGVINRITKKPKAKPAYSFLTQVGSYHLMRGVADFTGPVNRSKTLLYRLVLASEGADSFRDYVNSERWTVSPALTYLLSARTQVTASFEYLRSRQVSDPGLPIIGTDPVPVLPRERFLGSPDIEFDIHKRAYRLFVDHRFNPNWSARLGYTYTVLDAYKGNGQLVGRVNATDRRTINRQFGLQVIDSWAHVTQFDLLGQFKTGPITHRTLLGTDVRSEHNYLVNYIRTVTPAINITLPYYVPPTTFGPTTINAHNLTNANSAGFYLQNQASVIEGKIQLITGLRYDTLKQIATSYTVSNQAIAFEPPAVTTPRLALVVRPWRAVTFYGTYGESFRPDTSGRPIFGSTEKLAPETGTLKEVGAKSDFFDSRVSINVALYDIQKENIVSADPLHPGFIVQDGQERSKGYEISFNLDPTRNLTLFGGFNHVDAKVISDPQRVSTTGALLPNTPRNSYQLWTKYNFRDGPLKRLGLGLGVQYVDERKGRTNTTNIIPEYTVFNGQVNYAWRDYRFNVYVANLFDKLYYTNGSSFNVRPGTPLSFRASVRVTY